MLPGCRHNNRRIGRDEDPFFSSYRSIGKMFSILMASTFTFLIVIGFAVWLQIKVMPSPDMSMRGIMGVLPEEMFLDLLRMEISGLDRPEGKTEIGGANLSHLLLRWLAGVNPQDPASMLASEISGLGGSGEKAVLFRRGIATHAAAYPTDHTPSLHNLQPVPDRVEQEHAGGIDGADEGGLTEEDGAGAGRVDAEGFPPDPDDPRHRIRAFIYHSHNRESWVPELEGVTRLSDAYDPEINITLLGKRLAERLEEEGIGAIASDKDYPSAVKEFNYNLSYSYSLKTVQEAAVTYPELLYFFDIHRDSQRRELTTAEIEGISYAQVYFVIGQKNPNWKANEEFARQIHERLEERYPGLSRGIFGKTASTGNGEYNQHVSPHAILIEVGGPENTLEESNRTIDVLAEVISEIFWDAEKVDAPIIPGDVISAAANLRGKE